MKKSIILAGAVALAFSFNACMKGDNGEQAKKDWAAIDSIAGAKSTAFTDSLNMVCMNDAMAKGMAMADSMMNAKKGKGGTKKTTVTPPPPPPPVDPKKDKMGGNNSNTETKTDKMSGGTKTTTDTKKDKMGGKPK